jgi:hypothetical protein
MKKSPCTSALRMPKVISYQFFRRCLGVFLLIGLRDAGAAETDDIQASAAVVSNTPLYDLCLQDDTAKRFLEINTQTGQYNFTEHFYDNCRNLGTWSGTGTVKAANSGLVVTLIDKRSDQTLTAVVRTVKKTVNKAATYTTKGTACLTDIYHVTAGTYYVYNLDGTIADKYTTRGGTFRDRHRINDKDTADNTCTCQ